MENTIQTTVAQPYHVPALLQECMEGLAIRPDGVYVDATFGGGGHSRAILERLGPGGKLYAFDQDEDVFNNLPQDDRLVFVHSNFRFLANFLRFHGVEQVDGVLADLGVSSHHFDDASRGFSFRFDGNLDMRMNQRGGKSAAQLISDSSEEELARLFKVYGELPQARRLAQLIVKARTVSPIDTIARFREVVEPAIGHDKEKKDLAKAFQALRIEVNHEMEALEKLLEQSLAFLRPGGRIAIISYHSLEDRLVKNFMRSGNFEGNIEQDFYGNRLSPIKPVNNKVIVPGEEEMFRNPRSRSARLRVGEKLLNEGFRVRHGMTE